MESRLIHVTDCLKAVGAIDARYFNEAAAWRGTAIHQACQLFDEGTLNRRKLDKQLRPYLRAWEKFLKQTRVKRILAIEKQVICEEYGYCGTPDRVLELLRWSPLNGIEAIVDIKSNEKGIVHPATRYQTAAYAYAYAPTKLMARYGVALTPYGTYNVAPYPIDELRSDFRKFLKMLVEVKGKDNGRTQRSHYIA